MSQTIDKALEYAKEKLKEAQETVVMIERLKKFITVSIDRLNIFSESVWVTVTPMSLKEAMAYMKKLKAKNFYLEVTKSTYNGSENCVLVGMVKLDGVEIKLDIPISDIKEPVMRFSHSGSTTRSKVTGVVMLRNIEPFTRQSICHSLHQIRFYLK